MDTQDGTTPGERAGTRPEGRTTDPAITEHTTGDLAGETIGGVSGAVAGAALGSLGGPVGTVIGGIAGALGGWWAGRAVNESAERFTAEEDSYYRNQYDRSGERLADRSYDQVRPAYQLGHIAGHNPAYAGRPFETVESDLRRGWSSGTSAAHGEWEQVRVFVRDAYTRSSSSPEAQRSRERASNSAEEADRRLDDAAGVRYF